MSGYRQLRAAIGAALLSVVLSVTLAFFALRVAPYDAITTQLLESGASQSTIDARRAALGLDDPVGVQLVRYLLGLMVGDLGVSLVSGQPVNELLMINLAPTLELGVTSLIIGITFGVSIGLLGGGVHWDGVHRVGALPERWRRRVRDLFISLALSFPSYWLGTLMLWVFAVQLDWLPASGAGGLERLILPAVTLGVGLAGGVAAMTTATLSSVYRQEFIRVAYGKGLGASSVSWTHVLRAAAPGVVAFVSTQAVFVFSGAVITEIVFSRPGLGRLLVDAVIRQDYPIVQGVVVWSSIVVAGVTLLAGVLLQHLDPRLRQQ